MTNSHELAEHFAEQLAAYAFTTPNLEEPVEVVAVIKSITKTQDIKGLTIHVIPILPECQTDDRGGEISVNHAVGVLMLNRREAGKANNSETLYAWQKKHAAAVLEMITQCDWVKWVKEVSDSAVLSEIETNGVTFDGVDASTVFAQVVVFTVEDSE